MSTVTRVRCVWDEILATVDGFEAAMREKCAQSQGCGMFGPYDAAPVVPLPRHGSAWAPGLWASLSPRSMPATDTMGGGLGGWMVQRC